MGLWGAWRLTTSWFDIRKIEEYDSKAAGGLGDPTPPPRLCKEHRYERSVCSACAEEKNHGEKIRTRPRPTKSRPSTGRSYRQEWYDTQAKTLEELRRGDEDILDRPDNRRSDRERG